MWSVEEVLEWVQDQHPTHMGAFHEAIMKHAISGTATRISFNFYRGFFVLFYYYLELGKSDLSDVHSCFVNSLSLSLTRLWRPRAAEITGSSPGAARRGGGGAAAGDLAGPPAPQSSGRNQ